MNVGIGATLCEPYNSIFPHLHSDKTIDGAIELLSIVIDTSGTHKMLLYNSGRSQSCSFGRGWKTLSLAPQNNWNNNTVHFLQTSACCSYIFQRISCKVKTQFKRRPSEVASSTAVSNVLSAPFSALSQPPAAAELDSLLSVTLNTSTRAVIWMWRDASAWQVDSQTSCLPVSRSGRFSDLGASKMCQIRL